MPEPGAILEGRYEIIRLLAQGVPQPEQQAALADLDGSRDGKRLTAAQAVEDVVPQRVTAEEHRGIANRSGERVRIHHRFDTPEGYLSLFARALHLPD